ncbi:MAG: DUF2844 domain-containing protein [Steroidobacteraceae bacterium]|jgi:hypothetical protein
MSVIDPRKFRQARSVATAALAGAALAGCGALLLPAVSQAALGGPYASIAADQTHMRASIKVTAQNAYEVHELTLPSGTVVREYVSSSGVVFAVAWNGPSLPDLRQMLGPYFADFTSEAQLRRGGLNHMNLNRSDLSIQSGGHMRAFVGRAVLPQAVPSGVSNSELR